MISSPKITPLKCVFEVVSKNSQKEKINHTSKSKKLSKLHHTTHVIIDLVKGQPCIEKVHWYDLFFYPQGFDLLKGRSRNEKHLLNFHETIPHNGTSKWSVGCVLIWYKSISRNFQLLQFDSKNSETSRNASFQHSMNASIFKLSLNTHKNHESR